MTAERPGAGARYRAGELEAFAQAVLAHAGLAADRAADVAAVLVEGDCLGKSTHGLALLPPYLREIGSGGMTLTGEPEVVNDAGACLTWDGRKLPGAWLVRRATAEAMARARRFGMGAVAIQRSHHTGCLGAYLGPAVDAGQLMLLTLTDPGHRSVAPFGGTSPALTSNPIAFGAPTPSGPVMIDMSTALMTNGGVVAYRDRGERLPHPFLMDGHGRPTTDPAILQADPPGTILPLGGMEAGHKGFSLGLMVELLTGCLGGRGRDEGGDGWSAAVFILVLDPAAFAGQADFLRQAGALSDLCRSSQPREGFTRVALPGKHARERSRAQRRDGVRLSPGIVAGLAGCAAASGVGVPAAIEPG